MSALANEFDNSSFLSSESFCIICLEPSHFLLFTNYCIVEPEEFLSKREEKMKTLLKIATDNKSKILELEKSNAKLLQDLQESIDDLSDVDWTKRIHQNN